MLDASFQGVKRVFVLDFNDSTANEDDNLISNINNRIQRINHPKHLFPRVKITDYNVLIDGRYFDDQAKYDEVRKIAIKPGDDFECFLNNKYFKDHEQLIAVNLSKQKELDADSMVIQHIQFYGMLISKSQVSAI